MGRIREIVDRITGRDRGKKAGTAPRRLKTASVAHVHGDESEKLAKEAGIGTPRQAQRVISKKAPRGMKRKKTPPRG